MSRISVFVFVAVFALEASADVFNIENVPSQAPAFCNQETKKGACRASYTRFQYNATAGKCVSFTWGGCGDSKNLFEKKTECERVCVRAPEHQRAFGSSDQDCTFEINPKPKCGFLDQYEVADCAGFPLGANQNETQCYDRGCCWLSDLQFCYQKPSGLAPSTCKVNYASDTGFQGRVFVQALQNFPPGWIAYISFRKTVADAFCVLNDDYSSQVEITEALHGRNGFIVRGLNGVRAGRRLTFNFSGSFSNSTFTSTQCQALNYP